MESTQESQAKAGHSLIESELTDSFNVLEPNYSVESHEKENKR